ncbi:MAG: DUF805 domain-containing protein [Clostridia bacterium]|nr:DUF805 domain-containing protein [Clostridia bacterium]
MKINSDKIKQLRIENSWSQETLADKSTLSVRTIQRVENGNNTSLETIKLIAKAFDVEPNTLMVNEVKNTMAPWGSIKSTLLRFTDFSSKSTRKEFWYFLVFVLIILMISSVIYEKVYQILGIFFLIPFLAVGTRRLNDINRSGWWQLLYLVPFAQLLLFYFFALPSKKT